MDSGPVQNRVLPDHPENTGRRTMLFKEDKGCRSSRQLAHLVELFDSHQPSRAVIGRSERAGRSPPAAGSAK
jgi:hypothetical protein